MVFSDSGRTCKRTVTDGHGGALCSTGYTSGTHVVAFTGSTVQSGEGYLGVACVDDPATVDMNELNLLSCRVDLDDGEIAPAGSNSWTHFANVRTPLPQHNHGLTNVLYLQRRVRGRRLEMTLAFNDDGKATVALNLDGKDLGVAWSGLKGPLFPMMYVCIQDQVNRTVTLE